MLAIEYPRITVDGRDLTVRFSFAAQLLMGRRGLDAGRLNDSVGPGKPNSAYNWFVIFSCMVAENFMDQQDPQRCNLDLAPTPDYWVTLMQDRLPELTQACNSAILKAQEAQKTKLGLVPQKEQAS